MKLTAKFKIAAAIATLAAALAVAAACDFARGGENGGAPVTTAGISASGGALVGGAQLASGRAVMATDMDGRGQIQVDGEGKATIAPDVAILRLGVEVTDATVAEARSKSATAMAAVMAALSENGVADTDVQTSHFNIWPEYSYREDTPKVIGYQVSNDLIVKARDLDNVSSVIDDVIEAGGDHIRFNGLDFVAEDMSSIMAELREGAVSDAKDKATHFAELAEVTLGDVVFLSDSVTSSASPYDSGFRLEAAMAAPSPATPISAGELEATMTIRVVFEIVE